MTATTTTARIRRQSDGGVLLADALSVNAVSSGLTGVALLFGAPWLDELLGVHAGILAGVGAGLLLFVDAMLMALARPAVLRRASRWIVAADVSWVAGAAVVIAGDLLTPTGDVLLAVVSAAVAAFALAQAVGLRRAGERERLGVREMTISGNRTVGASPARTWELVSDAAGYADLAPGIAATTTDGDVREGMQRTCVDDNGHDWSETCTLLEPGRRYRMEVDTSTYPLRHRLLFDRLGMTWTLTPTGGGTRIDLEFACGVKMGILGRLAVGAMTRTAPHERILDACVDRLAAAAA